MQEREPSMAASDAFIHSTQSNQTGRRRQGKKQQQKKNNGGKTTTAAAADQIAARKEEGAWSGSKRRRPIGVAAAVIAGVRTATAARHSFSSNKTASKQPAHQNSHRYGKWINTNTLLSLLNYRYLCFECNYNRTGVCRSWEIGSLCCLIAQIASDYINLIAIMFKPTTAAVSPFSITSQFKVKLTKIIRGREGKWIILSPYSCVQGNQ